MLVILKNKELLFNYFVNHMVRSCYDIFKVIQYYYMYVCNKEITCSNPSYEIMEFLSSYSIYHFYFICNFYSLHSLHGYENG